MRFNIGPQIKEIGLKIKAKSREGLSMIELYKELKRLNNPIIDDNKDEFILVEQVEPNSNPNVSPFQFLWRCDKCLNFYHPVELMVSEHEKLCEVKGVK